MKLAPLEIELLELLPVADGRSWPECGATSETLAADTGKHRRKVDEALHELMRRGLCHRVAPDGDGMTIGRPVFRYGTNKLGQEACTAGAPQ